MSESEPNVLLAHDGELVDVRELLETLGVSFRERRGAPTPDERQTLWKVVVGSPRRVLELQIGAAGEKPTRIALIDGNSKTLIAMLRRSGVDLMVQRPVHPSALRLLLLHALYRGPEKRRHQRITIGAPVRFRAGLRKRDATLADLSLRGCRLISPQSAEAGQPIKVYFGTELGPEKPFALKGKVVRSGPTEGAGPRMQAIAVRFDEVPRDGARGLKDVIQAHLSGPHTLERAHEPAGRGKTQQSAEETAAVPSQAHQADAAASPPPDGGEDERREEPRHGLDRHIIALGVEATRVLIGRDISLGGMRVDRNDTIELGELLRIAVHVRARSEPLVVSARVERDDGDDGMVLRFEDLTEAAQNYLRKMVNFLPILAARGGDDGAGVIVSEILERNTREQPGSSEAAEA